MNNFQQAVERLTASSNYKKLAAYKPPFDPFVVMGIPYRELSHSHVLAWLLRDEANNEFRQQFVSWIVYKLKHSDLPVESDERPEVRLEFGDDKAGRIDVFAHFTALEPELAVAIEVKVWAGEQESQIKRYQDFLDRKYENCRKVVIFLTPQGERPETSEEESNVPVLNMSWGEIAHFIEQMRINACVNHGFHTQFSQHIRRYIMNEREEQRIVKKLLPDHAKTIQLIIDNLPSLQDFSEKWKEIVAEVCGLEKDSLDLDTYKSKGKVVELKIKARKWTCAGLPFTLMLYRYENAGVRVLLHNDYHEEHKEFLSDFAKSSGGIINSEFPRIRNWTVWRSVLRDDGDVEEPERTRIDAAIFYDDDAWCREVKTNLENQMGPLLELIKNRLNDDSSPRTQTNSGGH